MKMPIFRSTAAATIAVVAFILCYSAHASTRSTAGTPWEALQKQLNAGGTVTLTNDVTATSGDATLTVTNAVTLDLNGHTIDAAGLFGAISVADGGDLTLTNSLEPRHRKQRYRHADCGRHHEQQRHGQVLQGRNWDLHPLRT